MLQPHSANIYLFYGAKFWPEFPETVFGSTEKAGPENGGPKKDERTENAGLKMKDQMSGVDNAGPKHQDRKMEDQQPEADYEI